MSAIPVDAGSVGDVEQNIFEALNNLWLPYWPLWLLMQLGSVVAIYACAGLALAFRRYRLTVALLLAGTAAWWLAKGVKEIFGRPARPSS